MDLLKLPKDLLTELFVRSECHHELSHTCRVFREISCYIRANDPLSCARIAMSWASTSNVSCYYRILFTFSRNIRSRIFDHLLEIDNDLWDWNTFFTSAVYFADWDAILWVFSQKCLVQAIDINADGDGRVALDMACEAGHREIVEMLIDSGADINGKYGRPLMYACQNGHIHIVECLLNAGANYNIYDGSPIAFTYRKGHKDIIEGSPMQFACQNGHKDIVELLFDKGAHPPVAGANRDVYPLLYACLEGHKDIVELLLDRGADIRRQGREESALLVACQEGHLDIVELLLNRGADIHENSEECLLAACKNGHLQTVKLLLDRGADIHAMYGVARAALKGSHPEVVPVLIDRGARTSWGHRIYRCVEVIANNLKGLARGT
jgi:ankyrin repeat protein